MRPSAFAGSSAISTLSVCGWAARARSVSMTIERASSKGSMLEPGGELRAARHDGRVAIRAGGDHSDFDLQLIRYKIQIVARRDGQVLHVANLGRRSFPAGQRPILRFHLAYCF